MFIYVGFFLGLPALHSNMEIVLTPRTMEDVAVCNVHDRRRVLFNIAIQM